MELVDVLRVMSKMCSLNVLVTSHVRVMVVSYVREVAVHRDTIADQGSASAVGFPSKVHHFQMRNDPGHMIHE